MIKKPRQVLSRSPPTEQEIARARYVGSAEHKVRRWWGGQPKAHANSDGQTSRPKKQKTTVCRLVRDQDRDEATQWVQTALRLGQYKFREGDKTFPQVVWLQVDEIHWFGRCINSVLGEYKGWPVSEDELREFRD